MEREDERSVMRGMAEVRREMNKDNIIFLFLLDNEQEVVPKFSEL